MEEIVSALKILSPEHIVYRTGGEVFELAGENYIINPHHACTGGLLYLSCLSGRRNPWGSVQKTLLLILV